MSSPVLSESRRPGRPFSRWVLAGLALALAALLGLPGAVRAEPGEGARLFEAHCAGCHVQGGNIIRRRKTLKLAALEREGIASEAAIAAIAAAGVGQMSGYGQLLGDEGVAAVAAWVWQQAEAGWPRG
ncbi:c-type cytochrome [Cyanobium sp. CH-040]|uniref:c-type cytochrome n=1 Tax=Cyanobium sp. CH-040 TaxID=2823708 RepID=UPI0020CF799C|nr:c-type cytochrome [Cyanobium sp. CH-040]MCP9928900.1 c-type cytochrome [Cyanobium sp. CH-040]